MIYLYIRILTYTGEIMLIHRLLDPIALQLVPESFIGMDNVFFAFYLFLSS